MPVCPRIKISSRLKFTLGLCGSKLRQRIIMMLEKWEGEGYCGRTEWTLLTNRRFTKISKVFVGFLRG